MNCCKSKPIPIKPVPGNKPINVLPPPNQLPSQPISAAGNSQLSPNFNQNVTLSPNASGINGNSSSALRKPKSKIVYSAQDYDTTNLNNQTQFLPTPNKVTHFVQDRQERIQTYAQEINHANQSRLLQPSKLLTYDVDAKDDGVSKIPIINTFDYFTSLNHFYTYDSKDQKKPTNSYHEQINRLNPSLPNPQSHLSYSNSKFGNPQTNLNYTNSNLINPQSNLNNNYTPKFSGDVSPYSSAINNQPINQAVSGLNSQFRNTNSQMNNGYNSINMNRPSELNSQQIYNNDYTLSQPFQPTNTIQTTNGNIPITNSSKIGQTVDYTQYPANNTASGIRNSGISQYNNVRVSGIENAANTYSNNINNTASGIRDATNSTNNYNNIPMPRNSDVNARIY